MKTQNRKGENMIRPSKHKWCWVATETRQGWRLKLAIGNRDYKIAGLLLASADEVEKVCGRSQGNVLYIWLAEKSAEQVKAMAKVKIAI